MKWSWRKIAGDLSSMVVVIIAVGGISLSQAFKLTMTNPNLQWADLFAQMTSVRFVLGGLVSLILVGIREAKGQTTDEALAAKKRNVWDRCLTTLSIAFTITSLATIGG